MSLQEELPEADPLSVFGSTRAVIQAYVENDMWAEVVWGGSGCGKTRYVIKKLAQVWGEWTDGRDKNGEKITYVPLDGMNWDAWKTWMKHDLGDFIGMIDFVQNKGRQVLMGCLDDAGRVASNQKWQTKFGQTVNDYANVQRRDFACLNVTTPHPGWVLGHIRNMPGGHTVKVNRASGNKYQRQLRYASVYEGWLSPDLKRSGVKLLWRDWFDVWLPPKVEAEWEPVNQQYSRLALEETKKTYYDMMERGNKREAKRLKEEGEKQWGKDFGLDDPRR